MNAATVCPECAAPVSVPADVFPSEIVQCGDCALDLEVVALQPLSLALAPEEEEDWGE